MWFIGVEVEQDTSVPPPKKTPGSAPADDDHSLSNPGRGGTWVKACWVCAAGLSEPLPHYSLFFG